MLYLLVSLAGCLLGFFICGVLKRYRSSRTHTHAEAADAARLRAWSRALPHLEPSRRLVELQRRQATAANLTARPPAFKYNQSVKQNATGRGEEAATCSVCLGMFQLGETVRLLPACLHLYHVECIDPWLDAHSTCPICRSDTNPTTMDAAGLPPV